MRTFGPLFDQGAHFLRNDTQNRQPHGALHIVHRLDGCVQILDEEGQPDRTNQPDHQTQNDVHRDVGTDLAQRRLGGIHNFNRGARDFKGNALLGHAGLQSL